MRPSFQTRLALLGMVGLAMLEVTHLMRDRLTGTGAVFAFVLGFMPNLAAGFGMPLVVASTQANGWKSLSGREVAGSFVRICAFTSVGLLGWEAVQLAIRRMVFDPLDILATLLGALLAIGAFRWIRPAAPNAAGREPEGGRGA